MGTLHHASVKWVYHYTPLHYLPFIARAQSILCKPSLAAAGFPAKHLRSKSKAQDIARGFGAYAHLTLDPHPNILKAKLAAGFPHVQFVIPAEVIDEVEFSLCRYNVAMTRYLRKNGVGGFAESPTNGYYYDGHQIPVARTPNNKATMLKEHLQRKTMIEVLVHGDLELRTDTTVICYSEHDFEIAQHILSVTDNTWNCHLEEPPCLYQQAQYYTTEVQSFIEQALADSAWRGNGLEFDKV